MGEGFGEYIIRLRGSRTRKSVAREAGFTSEYLRLIENEGRIPKSDKLISLALALGREPRDVLIRAWSQNAPRAVELVTDRQARFPSARAVLSRRLEGRDGPTIRRFFDDSPLTPPEVTALRLWSTALLADLRGMDPDQARTEARELINDPDFVEQRLARFMEDNLTGWSVDLDTGRQFHAAASLTLSDILTRLTEGDESIEAVPIAPVGANLTPAEETLLADLFSRYGRLPPDDKAEIRSLLELAGSMAANKLDRQRRDGEDR